MALAPQLVQYQGSKRKLAPIILSHFPDHVDRLVEPFSGMAAVTVAAAVEKKADSFWINDINQPLMSVLKTAIETPEDLYERYKEVWEGQNEYPEGHVAHFYHIRDEYNAGDRSPEKTLYLLARCVKGAVRYSGDGKFNQSPDKRRHGTNPERIRKNAEMISLLLKGKTEYTTLDYRDMLPKIRTNDFLYMDPPYQGVTNTRDHRYYSGVAFDDLVGFLEELNTIGSPYILSYDGKLGEKTYGNEIPESLSCKKLLINAGKSSQATLLGRDVTTYEGLYLSKQLD